MLWGLVSEPYVLNEDNLLLVNSTITHHSETPEMDEEKSLTPENLVVLTWLRLIHNDLPSLVKPYGSEFRSRSHASSHSCKKYVPQPMRRFCVLWHPNWGRPLQTFLTTHPNSPQQQAGRNDYNFLSGGQQISSGVDMAEAFNKYFYSTFTHAPEVPLDAYPTIGCPTWQRSAVRRRGL